MNEDTELQQIKIAGVPEHFNFPFQKALKKSTDFNWFNFKGGTGAMVEALKNNEVDAALLLTEGAIKAINQGLDAKIVACYVKSPLIWGVHVAANSPFQHLNELEGEKAAISRLGSGSELMSYVNADALNWKNRTIPFEIVNSLDGGRKALKNGDASYFLWEKYTTQPFVDNGEFRRIGVCPTPWPCFVWVINNNTLNIPAKAKALKKVLKTVELEAQNLKNSLDSVAEIAKTYQLKEDQVKLWFNDVEWNSTLDRDMIETTENTLFELKVIDKIKKADGYIHHI